MEKEENSTVKDELSKAKDKAFSFLKNDLKKLGEDLIVKACDNSNKLIDALHDKINKSAENSHYETLNVTSENTQSVVLPNGLKIEITVNENKEVSGEISVSSVEITIIRPKDGLPYPLKVKHV